MTPCGLVGVYQRSFETARFQDLTAASKKMTVFWDVVHCSVVEIVRASEVLTASIIRELMMEAVSVSETSVSFYETARRNIPEDSHHPSKRR
jgi:hypothetical protein